MSHPDNVILDTEFRVLTAPNISTAASICGCGNCVICRAARLTVIRDGEALLNLMWDDDARCVLVDRNGVTWDAYPGHDGDLYLRTIHDPSTDEGYPAGDPVIAAFEVSDAPSGIFPLTVVASSSRVSEATIALYRHVVQDMSRDEALALMRDDLGAWHERQHGPALRGETR